MQCCRFSLILFLTQRYGSHLVTQVALFVLLTKYIYFKLNLYMFVQGQPLQQSFRLVFVYCIRFQVLAKIVLIN